MSKEQNTTRRTKTSFRVAALASILALLMAVSAVQSATPSSKSVAASAAQVVEKHPWTAVGSTGVVSEGSLPFFGTFGPSLGFKGAMGPSIQARYNVTNTYDNNADPNAPGWNTLELGATANGGSVRAILWQVDCHGEQVMLCSVLKDDNQDPECPTCTFMNVIDFEQFWYYVDVRITRPNAMAQPLAHTVRVY